MTAGFRDKGAGVSVFAVTKCSLWVLPWLQVPAQFVAEASNCTALSGGITCFFGAHDFAVQLIVVQDECKFCK
jgi:hypothetical protein